MKLTSILPLDIPDVKVFTFARFADDRGYFTETYRFEELKGHLGDWQVVQANESFSHQNVIRGLHFQWNPYMGKFVRTVYGHMIDLVLDIRKNSSTLGKIIAYDMSAQPEAELSQWIWVPPGFAHGNLFLEPTMIEYFCSGAYSPGCEAGISPLSQDIDWSICDGQLKAVFDNVVEQGAILTEKDRNGFTLKSWLEQEASNQFVIGA